MPSELFSGAWPVHNIMPSVCICLPMLAPVCYIIHSASTQHGLFKRSRSRDISDHDISILIRAHALY